MLYRVVMSTLEKYQKFRIRVLGPRPIALELTIRKADKENLRQMETAFVMAEYFQNLLYSCL